MISGIPAEVNIPDEELRHNVPAPENVIGDFHDMKIRERRCKFCGEFQFKLMDMPDCEPYFYHYSQDYSKGCRQRINYNDIDKYAEWVEVPAFPHSTLRQWADKLYKWLELDKH